MAIFYALLGRQNASSGCPRMLTCAHSLWRQVSASRAMYAPRIGVQAGTCRVLGTFLIASRKPRILRREKAAPNRPIALVSASRQSTDSDKPAYIRVPYICRHREKTAITIPGACIMQRSRQCKRNRRTYSRSSNLSDRSRLCPILFLGILQLLAPSSCYCLKHWVPRTLANYQTFSLYVREC